MRVQERQRERERGWFIPLYDYRKEVKISKMIGDW